MANRIQIIKGHYCKSILYFLLLFIVFSMPAWAASLNVNDITAKPGDSVTIDVIFASEGDEVSAINFDVQYDGSRLTLAGVTLGTIGTAANKVVDSNTSTSGLEKVIVFGLNSTALGDGVLLSLTFAVNANAADGDAAFTIAAVSGATGAATPVTVYGSSGVISVDAAPPVVTITAPVDGASFGQQSITVTGMIDDAAITHIDVNGQMVPVVNGAFTVDITLVEGHNTITVTATDDLNNVTTVSITVTYLLGDVNEDGIIDATDVSVLRDQILGRLAVTQTADVNADNVVNVLDLQVVVNKL